MTVNREDFLQWRKDPVTKAIFAIWEDVEKTTEQSMLSRALIRDGAQGQLKLNELLGYRIALRDVLEFEILDEEENKNDDESSERTGIQHFGETETS